MEAAGPVTNVRIIMIGDSSVGKTALIRRYYDDVFDDVSSSNIATIGVD